MRPVRAVGVYMAWVFVGGALLAPALYQLVQNLAALAPALVPVASKPFPRYVNRALLILALAGLVPFLRAAGLKHWRDVGLGWRPGMLIQLSGGFLAGFASLACLVALALAFGARELSRDISIVALAGEVGKAALAAAVVAPLEEIVFRGALYGSLRKVLHWPLALALSSLVFALLHFFERAKGVSTVTWTSGFVVLGQMVSGMTELSKVLPGFLNLALVGLILGLAYQRLGALYFSIGLHAGWIFWLKSYGFLTASAAGGLTWMFGTAKLINGWAAFLLLLVMLSLLNRWLRPQSLYLGWKERPILG